MFAQEHVRGNILILQANLECVFLQTPGPDAMFLCVWTVEDAVIEVGCCGGTTTSIIGLLMCARMHDSAPHVF
jgi:hypothetical protein